MEKERKKGRVKWFHPFPEGWGGFGVIRTEEGAEVFVHFSEISTPDVTRLRGGQWVTFVPEWDNLRGRLAATDVRLISPRPEPVLEKIEGKGEKWVVYFFKRL